MKSLNEIFKKRKPLSPKVIFMSPEAKRLINLWLGVEKSLTEGSFSIALSSMGFNSEETVVLNNYNSEDSSIAYTTADKDKTVINRGRFKILTFPDPTVSYIVILHTITMIDDDIDKTYEYHHCLASLYLKSYTIKNNPTGFTLTRNFTAHEYKSNLNNDQYKLSIIIRKKIQPETRLSLPVKMEPFYLKNEEVVEKYLLGLSLPINLIEVYEKVTELALDNISDYDLIEFKIQSKNNNKELQTTDLIRLDNNRLTGFRGIWDGKDIFVDQAGNCSIEKDNLSIIKRSDETVNLNVKAPSLEEISNFKLSEAQMIEIKEDLQEVESLVKKKILRL